MMKIFIYKLLAILVGFYIIFQLTIGLVLKDIKNSISNYSSEENILFVKEKIREELKNGLSKDKILSPEDAKLIKKFYFKIKKEIENSK